MMTKPIKNEADHTAALREIERLWEAEEGTKEGDRLQTLTTLVEAYEQARYSGLLIRPVRRRNRSS